MWRAYMDIQLRLRTWLNPENKVGGPHWAFEELGDQVDPRSIVQEWVCLFCRPKMFSPSLAQAEPTSSWHRGPRWPSLSPRSRLWTENLIASVGEKEGADRTWPPPTHVDAFSHIEKCLAARVDMFFSWLSTFCYSPSQKKGDLVI